MRENALSCMYAFPSLLNAGADKRGNESILGGVKEKKIDQVCLVLVSGVVAVAEIRVMAGIRVRKLVGVIKPGSFGTIRFCLLRQIARENERK